MSDLFSTTIRAAKLTGRNLGKGALTVGGADQSSLSKNFTFSIEELHYVTRFEGYDVPDPNDEAWLSV